MGWRHPQHPHPAGTLVANQGATNAPADLSRGKTRERNRGKMREREPSKSRSPKAPSPALVRGRGGRARAVAIAPRNRRDATVRVLRTPSMVRGNHSSVLARCRQSQWFSSRGWCRSQHPHPADTFVANLRATNPPADLSRGKTRERNRGKMREREPSKSRSPKLPLPRWFAGEVARHARLQWLRATAVTRR
jgi:hypothetical protein